MSPQTSVRESSDFTTFSAGPCGERSMRTVTTQVPPSRRRLLQWLLSRRVWQAVSFGTAIGMCILAAETSRR